MTTAQPPTVDFVIPTLNSARTLRTCLEAIARQDYPREAVWIIIADGGSTDDTVAVAESFDRVRVVANDLKTGEAGKAAGIAQSSGDLIALVDSDNVLDDPMWLARMIEPFSDPDIVAAEPLAYTRRDDDPALTRYFAMLGMNDPLCLFLGNYDRMCLVTGKWTGLRVEYEEAGLDRADPRTVPEGGSAELRPPSSHEEWRARLCRAGRWRASVTAPAEEASGRSPQCGSYLKLTLTEARLPTIGANGFVFRRSLLEHVSWQPYFFDIDVMHQAVQAGCRHVAKVKCGIVHLYCSTLSEFARKQDRRIKDFLFFAADRQRTYPWKQQNRLGILWFCLATATLLPLLVQMLMGWRRKRDAAWLYHVPVCWITLWIYGRNVLAKGLGIKPRMRSREGWQRAE
jgi:hypothetical protein